MSAGFHDVFTMAPCFLLERWCTWVYQVLAWTSNSQRMLSYPHLGCLISLVPFYGCVGVCTNHDPASRGTYRHRDISVCPRVAQAGLYFAALTTHPPAVYTSLPIWVLIATQRVSVSTANNTSASHRTLDTVTYCPE